MAFIDKFIWKLRNQYFIFPSFIENKKPNIEKFVNELGA
jgi:hypothetical protein